MNEFATEAHQTIRVAIVDDHQVLVEALQMVLSGDPQLQVVGSAGTCAAAQELVARARPDVLLLDVSLPDGDGLALAPKLKRLCPRMHILVLTSLVDEKTLLRAIDTGVSGFVGKNRPAADVMAAIRQAAEAEIVMPVGLLVGLLSHARETRPRQPDKLNVDQLTPREREILVGLAQGGSSAAIAARLSISPLTVQTHIRNLMAKLGVHSRLEAVVHALQHSLIDPPL